MVTGVLLNINKYINYSDEHQLYKLCNFFYFIKDPLVKKLLINAYACVSYLHLWNFLKNEEVVIAPIGDFKEEIFVYLLHEDVSYALIIKYIEIIAKIGLLQFKYQYIKIYRPDLF